MIEITELDNLLNTLETSSLEQHGEYSMDFTNHEQTLIWNYIKDLKKENQQLKSQLEKQSNICVADHKYASSKEDEVIELKEQLRQSDDVIDECKKFISSLSSKGRDCMIYADVKKDILDILNKRGGIDE